MIKENLMKTDTNKGLCALAYLLFFIPLIVDGDNLDYRFHANQGLVLLIFAVIINVVGVIIPVIGWFIILPIGGILAFVLFIIGVVNALNGSNKPLPFIGGIELIK